MHWIAHKKDLHRPVHIWRGETRSLKLIRLYYINEEYTGHILYRNCLLKHVTEGKIEGRTEVTERRGRKREQLLDDQPFSAGIFF
jgi:hypothetical protein